MCGAHLYPVLGKWRQEDQIDVLCQFSYKANPRPTGDTCKPIQKKKENPLGIPTAYFTSQRSLTFGMNGLTYVHVPSKLSTELGTNLAQAPTDK